MFTVTFATQPFLLFLQLNSNDLNKTSERTKNYSFAVGFINKQAKTKR